ncbi:MAG: glycerophosphodiester phosphodiesterase [Candidatus Methanomethylicota archaeon]|uniref:Glycerophosphodiester phosphodiesterase n=1 Tax=Thermoproteota archaeon TaxID=2056631 RepID=A0A497F654_9CREN|nr:MAG: glycerophosphodiester phosphodiesterase [Candidatus Verstraetearchaeota archaeon]
MTTIKELNRDFFIVAHRGASAYEPENTLRAIKRAIEIGADAIEIDVRISRDGYAVVIHDETVDRTTNGTGKVSELTLRELKNLDAGLGEKIPLLNEVLDYIAGKTVLFIEIKVEEAIKPTLKEVEKRNLWNSVLFTSFNKEHLIDILNYNPKALTGLIYIKHTDGIIRAKKIGAKAVLPFHRLATKKAIAFARKLKLMVIPWTVDNFNIAETLKSHGANGIVTNMPDTMLKLKSNQ